ncbi:hypothetical protein ACK3TF_003167 [Chlorella vulgaris]
MQALNNSKAHAAMTLEHIAARYEADGASLGLLLDLLQATLNPAITDLEALYADVSGAPAPPSTESLQLAGAHTAATAAHLQLVLQVIDGMGPRDLGLEALANQGAGEAAAAAPPAGNVVIEDITAADDEQLGADIALDAILLSALYCADAQLQRPWAAGQVAAAAQQVLQALAAKLTLLQAELGQQVRDAPLIQEVLSTCSGEQGKPQQQDGVQQLVVLALPALTPRLRAVAAAKADHSRHSTARLQPYSGPENFERTVATGQLAWLIRQLSGRWLSTAASITLPVLLAIVEDPFPAVQACGLWAVQHLATWLQAEEYRSHGKLLLRAAQHVLAGCSDSCWPAAAAAAIAAASRLQGEGQGCQACHDVMAVLLDEGERGAHNMDRAEAWLAAVPLLFPLLGLQLTAHFGRLMPLLLGWCLAPQWSVRCAALEALLEVVRLTWQRMGVHAATVWRVLRRVHGDEQQRRQDLPQGPSVAAAAVAERTVDCALVLWFAAGADFQLQLLSGRGGADDLLLQAVMQRLEAHTPNECQGGVMEMMEEEEAQ